MTSRKCPWCGGEKLFLRNCMAGDRGGGRLYWSDPECGYSEVTYHDIDEFGYEPHASGIVGVYPVISCHKPRPPLPTQTYDVVRVRRKKNDKQNGQV